MLVVRALLLDNTDETDEDTPVTVALPLPARPTACKSEMIETANEDCCAALVIASLSASSPYCVASTMLTGGPELELLEAEEDELPLLCNLDCELVALLCSPVVVACPLDPMTMGG